MEPESCAKLLLEHVLGFTRTELLLHWLEPFPAEREQVWLEVLQRKAAGEPVQYITGEQEFYGLPFKVTQDVLIPRPETELLVEEALRLGDLLQASRSWKSLRMADIGVGSGAIAVTAAVMRPEWSLYASDVSREAIEAAERNAEGNGADARITFLEGDLLRPFIERGIVLDMILSNPPYIPQSDEAGLQPEVRLYEPKSALYGGEDGLDLYRRFVDQLKELPELPYVIGLEVGMGQALEVKRMLEAAVAWDDIYFVNDLAGIARHVFAVRGIGTAE